MFLFEFIERQWLQTDFSCLADNNNIFCIFACDNKKKSPQTFTGPVLGETRDNYAITKQESTQITIKLRKKKTRATSEGIPSSIDIEFLELNDNPYINALT